MHMRIPPRVKNRQENQPQRANNRRNGRANAQNLLCVVIVLRQPALMPQPSFRDEGQVEDHHAYRTTGDEQRLAPGCRTNVGDVCDVLVYVEGGVVGAADGEPAAQHGEEGACGARMVC